MYINEIFQIDDILEEEKRIAREKEIKVINVSHWNTAPTYQEYMLKNIILNHENNIFDYVYSYDFKKMTREQILCKVGVENKKNCMCLLTPSSTISILNIINYLKLNGYHKLCILEPAYFSVEQACIAFGLNYQKKSLEYREWHYSLPSVNEIIEGNFDAIWITSPIYSSGIKYNDSQINTIKKLINRNVLVIADETLSLSGQELCRRIPISRNFFSIYSPHKALFINSIKFSAIVCPLENDDFFEQWIDVLGGGLLSSNVTAILHFLSDNFDYCTQKSTKWFKNTLNVVQEVLKQFPKVYCDTNDIGAYKLIIINSNKKTNINDIACIVDIMHKKYVSYIPGIYHGYNVYDFLA